MPTPRTLSLLLFTILPFAAHAQAAPPLGMAKNALVNEHIGLLDAGKLRLTNGLCRNCSSSPQALWYFQDQLIAAPTAPALTAGVSTQLDSGDDVRQWAATPAADTLAYPVVTWIGAPHIIERARIDRAAATVTPVDGAAMAFSLVPKLATNRSYANAATVAYFSQRPVRLRGTATATAVDGHAGFVARTIWPADFAIDGSAVPREPIASSSDLAAFVRNGSLASDGKLATRLLWERVPGAGAHLAGKAVLGLMLNGAQGDDDESIGGHFAVATGRFGPQGEWADWAVNNFYNLDSVSEKGILAATVPMDNYLMDLNSGQQYYRPSYMLVAVLAAPRTAIAVQGGVQRILNHFYRHDVLYDHAANNCAGLSIDVLRALGWHVPTRGPTSRVKAIGAYAYVAAKQGSLAKGRSIYDYLTAETTRLYPAVAFDAATLDLLGLVGAMPPPSRTISPFEQQLKADVEAIIIVKIPQVPSSRVAGAAPAFSFDDYMARVPADQDQWQIVPVAPRPFPVGLRDTAAAPPATPSVVPLPIAAIGVAGLFGGGALWRRRRKKTVAS